MTFEDLKEEFRLTSYSGDPWGSVMAVWFDVAAELYHRTGQCPAQWQYSPPARDGDCREHDSYWFDLLESTATNDLTRFGNLLERAAQILEKRGLSY